VDGPGALGPSGGWRELPASAARARLGLRLLTEGALPGPFLATDDRLAELLVHVDGRLAADLAAAALSPLDDLQPRQREKLEATLRAWLDHQGRAEDAAAALGVHGQTVRYRLVRLRELFGDRLDDPEERFSLGLALRARAAVSPP
jgi:DNA-binding PucR family transcriptional regulator